MDTLQQRDHLNRLPTELKCAVTRYTHSLADRKALSLANKTWAEVVLPILWDTFTTDLLRSEKRCESGLSHPGSNIVKYIRNIHLLRQDPARNADDQLPMLLAAIPRGQLRGFKCTSPIADNKLKLMLQLHPKLEKLSVSGGETMSRVLESPWTTGSFSNLDSISINVDGISNEGFQKLWFQCTKLTHLRLTWSFNSQNGASFAQPALQEHHFLLSQEESFPKQAEGVDVPAQEADALQLSSLYAGNITLPKLFDTMFQRINVLALHELTLDGTLGVSKLVSALGSKFAEGEPQLKKLRILKLNELATDEFVQSPLLLLLAFHGLRQLHIQCGTSRKIDVDGIVNHGETLQDLLIVNGGIHRVDQSKCMSASDLQKIAIACPHIERLCLNIYEIDPDKPEGDVLGPRPGIPFEPTNFEEALNAIAGLRNLRILRLTNPPNFRKAYFRPGEFMRIYERSLESGEQRYAFQARADGIMRYLVDRNSNIKLLAFSPVEELSKAEKPDKNGHFWPNYFYYRGRLTDHKGTDIAVARPLADWKADFPGATVLEEL